MRKLIRLHKVAMVEIAAALLVLLFLYTGIVKLKDYEGFVGQMRHNPLLNNYRSWLAWMVPAAELGISMLLIIPVTRRWGLLLGGMLMAAFTLYVAYMLLMQPNLPCTCGGIISKLSWRGHLLVNVLMTAISFAGYYLMGDASIKINRSSRTPDNIVGNHF